MSISALNLYSSRHRFEERSLPKRGAQQLALASASGARPKLFQRVNLRQVTRCHLPRSLHSLQKPPAGATATVQASATMAAANGWLLRGKEELLDLPDGRRKLAYGACAAATGSSHTSLPAPAADMCTARSLHPAVVMGCPLEEAHAVVIYHHGIPASLVEAEPMGEAGAERGVAVVAFDRSGMGACVRAWRGRLAQRCA